MYCKVKDYDSAKRYFGKAIYKNPNLAEAYFGLGQIAVSKEEYPIAEENYLVRMRKMRQNFKESLVSLHLNWNLN